jgi:hypothetical protein
MTVQARQRFTPSMTAQARDCLRACGYWDDLIFADFEASRDRKLPLVAFAHRPFDARSSCIAFLPSSPTPAQDVESLRDLGVPLLFLVGEKSWDVWWLTSAGAQHHRSLKSGDVPRYFEGRKADFAPGAIFRAKTWARAHEARQLDFVDVGLLPLVESEAGVRLRQLFEDMVAHTMDALGMSSGTLNEVDAHWLVKANFWLLAGKLLRDKSVPNFTRLDLHDVQRVFDLVAEHYDAQTVRVRGRLTALRAAAGVAAAFASLRCISTETLGALYEEALLSKQTRKLLSVHRTPTYLVDYMLAKLSRWMEEDTGIRNCRVFEPACGHAPFLVGAVRLLSDLLPDDLASDRIARRRFLRKHIAGCDRDDFALEIARLSLTLADIPNPNGWSLDPVKDMFAGEYLDGHIAAASVVLVNPPFEDAATTAQQRADGDLRHHRNGQAAELLRRLLRSLPPEGIFGVVVPQSLLEGRPFLQLRRELLSSFELREISVFPDKMFQFADVETAIILGRRAPQETPAGRAFTFRRIREADMPRFAAGYFASANTTGDAARMEQTEDACLVIPDLPDVWAFFRASPRFADVASIENGFNFRGEDDPAYPAGEVKIGTGPAKGFVQGFANVTGSPDTHLLPEIVWLNQNSAIIRRAVGGTERNIPQVLLNHVRVSRDRWRHKAFVDEVGRPAVASFLLVRPHLREWSLAVLWAVCNSPLANAYTYAHSAKKHIMAGFLREMPVPDLVKHSPDRLEAAVRAYLAAAREFSAKQVATATKSKAPAKARRSTKSNASGGQLLFDALDLDSPEAVTAARERLRALHWRVDAEVLRLYALPPKIERELLDFFGGVPRVGVPFVQTEYIPRGHRDVQTLDDWLRITDEWEATEQRRTALLEKEFAGRIDAADADELKDVTRLLRLRRRTFAPLPIAELEVFRDRLKREQEWEPHNSND